jgi:serine/threonine protein kinase
LYPNQPKEGSSSNDNDELWDRFGYLSNEGLTILTKLLEYDPQERWTAQQALESAYFSTEPLPAVKMPRFAAAGG